MEPPLLAGADPAHAAACHAVTAGSGHSMAGGLSHAA
jgi:hypothetical protein